MKILGLIFTLSLIFTTPFVQASFRDDAPPIKDPFEGLAPKDGFKTGSQLPISNISNKKVAIILTDNTNVHLKWSDEVAAEGRSGADKFFGTLFGGTKLMEESQKLISNSYRASAITAVALSPFLDSCKEIKLMNDLAEFKESGFDFAAIIDITFMNYWSDFPLNPQYKSGVYLKTWIIYPDLSSGPTIAINRETKLHRDKFFEEIAEFRKVTFNEYYASVHQVLGKQVKSLEANSELSKSSEQRLRDLDKLRREGLITESESDAKRKQILNDL